MGNPSEERPIDLAELQRQLQSLFDGEGEDTEATGWEEEGMGKHKGRDDGESASPRRRGRQDLPPAGKARER